LIFRIYKTKVKTKQTVVLFRLIEKVENY